MKYNLLVLSLAITFSMVGCNGKSGSGVIVEKTSLENLTEKVMDSESGLITDSAKLRIDISALFGDADGEPIPVQDDDTVQDVIDRGRL